MKVWSVVVLLFKRELSSLQLCLLVCNLAVYCVVALLVVMEWTATITGDHKGLFLDSSPRRKNWGDHFPRQKRIFLNNC
jgi:hypothetical protein